MQSINPITPRTSEVAFLYCLDLLNSLKAEQHPERIASCAVTGGAVYPKWLGVPTEVL